MIQEVDTQPFRVLVAGYINLNVIDGSAFFVSGVAAMLSELSAVEVDILTANPVEKTEVLEEVMYRPNVTVLDPYITEDPGFLSGPKAGRTMSRSEYASLIAEIHESYDAIILRDTETASILTKMNTKLGARLFVYVTGIHTVGQKISKTLKEQLVGLFESDAKFICQTEYIASALREVLPSLSTDSVHILTPHVPDSHDEFEQAFKEKRRYDKFVYTGKFFEDWNPDKILASFKDLNFEGYSLRLDVAGDQFRKSESNPNFIKNTRWLLDSTPGVRWHGRVPREESRRIIDGADIGIGWRAEALNESTELSTKILEYGIMARPSILNRTPLHEELLGSDYPLFANSMTEFKELLRRIPDDAALVKAAAERCFSLAKCFSYSAVRPKLLAFLGNSPMHLENCTSVLVSDLGKFDESLLELKHRVLLRGQWVDILRSTNSDLTIATQLHEIMLKQDNLGRLEKALRQRKNLFLTGASRQPIDTPKKSHDRKLTNRPEKTQGSLESNLQRIARLEEKIVESERLREQAQARLSALRNSRLGKIQLEIWRQKRSSVSSSLPSTNLFEVVARRATAWLISTKRKRQQHESY